MKAAIMPQTPKGDISICSASGTNNAVAMTPTPSQATILTGTPIRSRNQIRMDKQTDDKSEVPSVKGKAVPKPPEEFYKDLQQFHEKRGTPIRNIPRITGLEVNLHRLYCEVTERGGFQKVNMRDEWDDILPYLGWKEKIVNGSAGLKYVYRRYLEKYERLSFFGEDPDKAEAMEAADMAEIMGISSSARGGRGTSRYPTSMFGNSTAPSIAMSYNYKQHHVSMEKRRHFKLSTDLYRPSPYEKLMLSLLSPLPNEQDFAINTCTLMANESKYVFKLNEYPKLLDALLAHTGVFSDYPMRKVFEHIYNGVRHHSLHGFWRDLLYDRPQILDLCMDEHVTKEIELYEERQCEKNATDDELWNCSKELDFLNLGRGMGKEDYIGQRILQVTAIFRNLSFFEENIPILVKNKTFLRFLVMGANIRWSNIHIQALEIAGNLASEVDLLDPSVDEFSRCLMATVCDGVESTDRAVIINCLEILYKLCQRDSNEDYVLKCLPATFYSTVALFLSLNDLMLLIFTLEAIYALTSLGSKTCHSILQIRGIVDQLVSLITIKAQTYSPDGCILMRVVEKLPGNMVPVVAPNITNMTTVAVNPKINHSVTTGQQMKTQNMSTSPMMTDVESIPAPTAVIVSAPHQDHSQMPNYTHDDEQFALAWLGVTFEKTNNPDSHIEQQELYRMYLSHCQKAGKHSVVNHLHFPRLMRLLFNNSVGPVAVRKFDGSELPGLHYVSIRVRAQPLILQQKPMPTINSPGPKQGELASPNVKSKGKKAKLLENASTSENVMLDNRNRSILIGEKIAAEFNEARSDKKHNSEIVDAKSLEKIDVEDRTNKTKHSETASDLNTVQEASSVSDVNFNALGSSQTSQSSMIKSLLANKVNQRQQKQQSAASTSVAVTLPNVNTCTQQPIKVASTDISALVNNPLMQNTPVKVGQTTIKPLNPQMIAEKKVVSESTPPPLAPLSGSNVVKERPIIITNQKLEKATQDVTSASNIAQKRKLDDPCPQNKRLAIEPCKSANKEAPITPSKNAANLYAEMAASILEDEDLEEFSPSANTSASQPNVADQSMQHQSSLVMQQKISQPTCNMQRQLVFQSSQPHQLKLTQTTSGSTAQQIPNAMATIKTDQGLQTVPVILHQKPLESTQPQSQIIQQVIQPTPPPQAPTQYVLATNQQGQTYLVAQQAQPPPPPPQQQPTQTVLVTQTPQQQSTGAKTIIILQQQHTQPQQIITTTTPGQPQKMIMTTPQGQQVLVTQRPQTPQQIYINPQTGSTSHLSHASPAPTRQIIQTTQQQGHSQLQAGQISPSLLNQLNQIPATIKLHQPIPQAPPTSKLNMPKGGPLSIVQTSTNPSTPVAIPQLQQHQSIIQQHIISGPAEKRHVILGAGRAIEIKETLITPTQPPAQQCQLNAQTIITTQQPGVATQPIMQQQNQQVQQTIRAVIEQHQHPSIIQQKISTYNAMPSQSVTSSQPGHLIQVTMSPSPTITQAPALLAAKISDQTASSFMQNKPIPATQPSLPTVILPSGSAAQTVFKKGVLAGPSTIIKPSLPTVKLPTTTTVATGPPPLAAVTNISHVATNPLAVAQGNAACQTDSKREDSQKSAGIPQTSVVTSTSSAMTTTSAQVSSVPPAAANVNTSTAPPQMAQQQPALSAADMQWLYICDWRNCPRKKFKSLSDLQHHVCTAHAPDHLDISAQIFCQWGVGPGLCDGVPRKRFCLMTHLLDRHLTTESLRAAAQRRIATGMHNIAPTKPTVTIVRNIEPSQQNNTPSPSPSTSSSSSWQTMIGPSALKAITRHNSDFINSSEFMDEKEGPVTKSIRLTAALILRNLVMFTTTAKRGIRRHEAHLSNIALSNVEASGTVSNILYEMNN